MTPEEKAKAYDEAVNKLRRFMAQGVEPLITRADVQDFFPELAENEDERIRKEIIAFLKENLETGRAEETWSLSGLKRWIVWLEKQVEKKPASSEKTCKNDTILDLLQKMPSYITVDGIFYHFILRKTALAYTAYYAGEEEGSGKVIFAMTAFSPIDLLNEMLEKLKEEGLLE